MVSIIHLHHQLSDFALDARTGGSEDQGALGLGDGRDSFGVVTTIFGKVLQCLDTGFLDRKYPRHHNMQAQDILGKREHVAVVIARNRDAEGNAGVILEGEPATRILADLANGASDNYRRLGVVICMFSYVVGKQNRALAAGVLTYNGTHLGNHLVALYNRLGLIGRLFRLGTSGEKE